ncbi:MAG TPA: MBL fold metallo-hydrolase [Myxococcota bacterium]|nr:MBL fold metallo-hydrolase [Myxococcota bacterium]HQK50477.1 MBL fold metallo-hydrolase [Myxococcota bacterium]
MLRFRSLRSGSSGNMALVETSRARVAVDLGIPTRRDLLEEVRQNGFGEGAVPAAVLLSHAHSDHLGWAGLRWNREARIPLLGHREALSAAAGLHRQKTGREMPWDGVQEIRPGATYLVGDLEVTPFEVSHDVRTFGFLFRTGSGGMQRRLVMATDLGQAGVEELPYFRDVDAVVIEANYDEGMLQRSPRHPLDKARVASSRGHLSNLQSGGFLQRVGEASLRLPQVVVLAHLSRDHNEPRLAEETVRRMAPCLDHHVPVLAAPAFEPGPVLDF